MKKIKVGGGGIDAEGKWYRYEEEVEMTDEEYAAWQKSLVDFMRKPRPDHNQIMISQDAYDILREALDSENPNE